MTVYDLMRITLDSFILTIAIVWFMVPFRRNPKIGFFILFVIELLYRALLLYLVIHNQNIYLAYKPLIYLAYMMLRVLWFAAFVKETWYIFLRVYASLAIVSYLATFLYAAIPNNNVMYKLIANDRPTNGLDLCLRLLGSVLSLVWVVWVYRRKWMENFWKKPLGLMVGLVFYVSEMIFTLFGSRFSVLGGFWLGMGFQLIILWIGLQYTAVLIVREKLLQQNQELEKEIELKYVYYQKKTEQEEEIRKIRHDLANHLQVIHGFQKTKQEEAVKEYQARIQQSYFKLGEIEKLACERIKSCVTKDKRRVGNMSRGRKLITFLIINIFFLVGLLVAAYFKVISIKYILVVDSIFCTIGFLVSAVEIYREKKKQKELRQDFCIDIEDPEDEKLIRKIGELSRNLPAFTEKQTAEALQEMNHYRVITFTDNSAVNIMLNQKMRYCKENGITFDINLVLPDSSIINPADLIGLLGNLVDNAIDACIRSDNGKAITLSSRIRRSVFTIKIKNDKSSEHQNSSGQFVTWKENREEHGMGMKIIEEIVKKYDGIVEYRDEVNCFISIVSLLTDGKV